MYSPPCLLCHSVGMVATSCVMPNNYCPEHCGSHGKSHYRILFLLTWSVQLQLNISFDQVQNLSGES